MERLNNQTRAVREYAQGLDDSLFDGDSQVRAIREEIAAAEARHREIVARLTNFDTRAIETEIAALAEQIDEERAGLASTAYGDLSSGDTDLTATMAARENIRRLVWRREALEGALHHYRTAGVESGLNRQVSNAADAVTSAEQRLAERLEHLKVQSANRTA